MGRQALGMGLKALIPDTDLVEDVKTHLPNDSVLSLDVNQIVPNPYQPRRDIDPKKLQDLVESIKEKGVVQPILVRRKGNQYELIAGERRFQAVKIAKFDEIPAILRDVDDVEMLELALIENIQREDLNPVDEAMAYRQLMDEFGQTQAEVAKRVGKERSTLSNSMRLLKLPIKVQNRLRSGLLSVGHARALLGLPTSVLQEKFCEQIIDKGLTVRDTEKMIRREVQKMNAKSHQPRKDSQVQRVKEQLQQHFQTKIDIRKRGKKGKLYIEFYSWKDLERVLDLMGLSVDELS
ncbi:MAG: hypothetical protein B6244_12500 [Candidatus Cloacimonetes bacterium 4572_55]|nr:MAG: hypothetical protein B6244_12500 [Candidatus Cloacimonetes bacterium 4572_55]